MHNPDATDGGEGLPRRSLPVIIAGFVIRYGELPRFVLDLDHDELAPLAEVMRDQALLRTHMAEAYTRLDQLVGTLFEEQHAAAFSRAEEVIQSAIR